MIQKDSRISRFISAVIVSIPLAMNLSFFLISGKSGVDLVSAYIVTGFVLGIMFLMIYKGNIHKYRKIFFIVIAFSFFPSFIGNLIETRGQMTLSDVDIVKNEVPFCHIVTPLAVIPYALTKTLIFPARLFNHYASVYSMLLIWLISSVTLGRGWCSWVCFYGGWDEASSSIGKKKRLSINPSGPFARYFNYTVLLFLALVSLKTLSVVYCEWFCPFKLITEYGEPGSLRGFLQFIFMVVLFFGLLIVMPYLTKKRFQCAVFCPFGAFQSFFNKISIFKVVIDRKKCTDCQVCAKACPTLSLNKEQIKKGHPDIRCTMCGACVSSCSKKAINIRFKWFLNMQKLFKTSENRFVNTLGQIGNIVISPTSFLAFTGLLIGSIVSSGFMTDTLTRFFRFIMGGL